MSYARWCRICNLLHTTLSTRTSTRSDATDDGRAVKQQEDDVVTGVRNDHDDTVVIARARKTKRGDGGVRCHGGRQDPDDHQAVMTMETRVMTATLPTIRLAAARAVQRRRAAQVTTVATLRMRT